MANLKFKNPFLVLFVLSLGVNLFLLGYISKLNTSPLIKNEAQKQKTEQQADVRGESIEEQQAPTNTEAKVSITGNPVLGLKSTAKVAIVEFSDFECPFCKRFKDESLPQIKREYIETGKAILIYNHLPLPFHNPAAEKEAMASECVLEQGGEEKFYQYHDKIYDTTQGNGQGLTDETLTNLAADLKVDTDKFAACLSGGKMKAEVDKDIQKASSLGISGTPTFIIGKLGANGEVIGEKVTGAQPFSVFKSTIDKYL